MTQDFVPLISALIPGFVSVCVWRRRGKPGARPLAALMLAIALWGVVHSLELIMSGASERVLYLIEQTILLLPAPLWFIFAIRYTGRDRWLTRARAFVIIAVAAVVMPLVLLTDPASSSFASVALFWLHLIYRTAFMILGSVLLLIMLINSQRLYIKQSLCLLVAFLGPWATFTIHQFEPTGPALNLYLVPTTFAASGFALMWAFFRYRLLDISPVAHDALVESMSDGAIVLDHRNRIIDLNPAAEHILRRRASEALGEDFRRVLSSGSGAAPMSGNRASSLIRCYEEQGQAHEEIQFGVGEAARHYDVALSSLRNARGKRTGHLVVLHEITERKLAVDRLDRMARYDALTGLPNRAYFYERLSEEMARARRTHGLFALLFLDLDRFKKVNDTLGHEVGDLLLKETAERLKLAIREYDFAARLAGDEFTVILPELTETPNAPLVAGRIVESLARPFHLAGNELHITTSVGVCFFPSDGADVAVLIKNADTAMYQAKQAGKNRYALFTRPELADIGGQLEIEAELVRAIERDELTLFYRPEIQANTTRTVGAEALLHWEHPERGLLRSEAFLPLVQESNFIFCIERWVLREACRQIRSWQKRYPTDSPLKMSVNLSARHFMHPDLKDEVSNILHETGIPPESLILEIPESVLGDDVLLATSTLAALKELGVRLAIDDFGVGSISLAQLTQSPLDILKIDGAFVSELQSDPESGKIISAIISLAHALGLRVVAQGVDNPQQLMRLKEMGCDAVQGSYFANSLSDRETSAFLVADLYY